MRRRGTSSASLYGKHVSFAFAILSMKMPFTKLLLAVGLIQIASYWFCGALSSPSAIIAQPQPDSPLYYQAARRIVEGHSFSYSEGSRLVLERQQFSILFCSQYHMPSDVLVMH